MKRILRAVALLIALGAVAFWLAAGAHRGWTKTSVAMKVTDEVTGLEGVTYEKRFIPGIDFLGAALLGAGVLGGVSILFRKNSTATEQH